MAIVGEPELSMFLSNHNSNVSPQLMDWTSGSRIMDQSNELCSSSYMSSDPYASQHLFYSGHSSQTTFDMSDNYHTPKVEPMSNSEFDYYGPPPQVSNHGLCHSSGGGSSFNPQRQVAHSYSNQPTVQEQQLHGGHGGGTLEEIDGMLKVDSFAKNFNDMPLQHHQDLEIDPFFHDLVSLQHPQSSAPQPSFHGSHVSSLGAVRIPGLDGGPNASHQQTRNLWMDEPSIHSQAVLMELQDQILVDTSSLETSQSMSSDTSTMTFASPSESAMSSNFYPEVGRSHGVSPTSLGLRGSLKVASPSSTHQQQMVLKQQQLVLKKEQHSSPRISTPVLGGGYSLPPLPEQSLIFRQGGGSGFGSSSSGPPISMHQLQNTQFNHVAEQILPGSSGPATGLQLVHMLLACAESVAENNLNGAEVILVRLREHVLPDGNPMQRLAAYFEQALTARLKKENSLSKYHQGPEERSLSQAEELEAFSVFYDCIPIGKFGHLTCNQILLDAVARESSIHVLDLHIFHGMQWPAFLQALALRGGEIPKLRLSAVGSDRAELRETGEKLHECAKNLKVPFEFCEILTPLEEFNADKVETRRGEALVINSFVQFHTILNKGPNRVNMLLADLRRLNPRVMAFAENDGNHNSNSFLTRFVEVLRYYSAMFDAFDASLPPDSPARMKMEEIFAAQKIRNVIACEGPAREDGHETMKYWHKKMESAHFRCVSLSSRAVSQAHLLLNLYYSSGYTLNTSECGYLALGWHGMPLIGVSAWN